VLEGRPESYIGSKNSLAKPHSDSRPQSRRSIDLWPKLSNLEVSREKHSLSCRVKVDLL